MCAQILDNHADFGMVFATSVWTRNGRVVIPLGIKPTAAGKTSQDVHQSFDSVPIFELVFDTALAYNFFEVCNEQSFLKRDMDFPIGRSRDDRGKSLPEYLNSVRLEAQDLVDKGNLTLGCDSKLISNKTAVGKICFHKKLYILSDYRWRDQYE